MNAVLQAAPSLLVGRNRELSVLHTHLAEAMTGHGSLVLMSGEAGIGKTALADTLASAAADAGACVLIGHCYDRTETPPYGPWCESLSHIITTDREEIPPSPVPPDRATAPSQDVFFAQMHGFLATLAANRPLVLVLEDVHWADTTSLDLIRFLARTLDALPLLLIVTYRDDELDRRHPLAALIPLLVRESPVVRLDLRPLDVAAVRALIHARYALADYEIVRLAAYLMERTEGNPLFVTELLRTLEEERLLQYVDARWQIGALASAPIPLLLRQIIDGRLNRLGDDADALLAVAAIIGQQVPLAIWEAVTRMDEETLLAVVERAEAAHLIRAWTTGDGLHFTHELVREVLYESVPALRRRRLHRQVGDALAALPSPDPDAVAYHLQQGGDACAAAWLVRAGERAEDAYALVTAATRFEAALTLLDERQGDPSQRGWLRLLAAALRRHDTPDRALAWVEEAKILATEANNPSLGARAQALHGLLRSHRGELRVGMADLIAAMDVIDGLPAETGAARRWEQQIDKIANRGTLIEGLAYIGRFAEARAQGERYLAASSASASTPDEIGAIADVHNGLSLAYVMQGELALARRSYAAAVAAYDGIGQYLATLFLQREELPLAVLTYQTDDLVERERIADAAERTARRLIEIGAHDASEAPNYARLPLLVLEGRWREARQIAAIPDTLNITNHLHYHNFALGPLARAQGDRERAWQYVYDAWPDGPDTAPGDRFVQFTVPLLLLASALALDAGDLSAARAWLDAHHRWLDTMDATLGRSEGHAMEARWYRAAGDTVRARTHAEQALRHATAPRQPLALLAAHRLLGILATDAGNTTTAASHLAEALALADACRAPYERALTLLASAELALAQGKTQAATSMLDEIRSLCIPMDAQLALAQAERIAARLTDAGNRVSASPAGLTTRQAEVLRLIAAGHGNATIADQLFISLSTVKVHVANIFAKLDVSNRAAATHFAVAHGLI